MAKNGLMMVEFFWGASNMINNNIKFFLVFKFLVFGYFTDPVFWPTLKKIAQKQGLETTHKKKLKTKNVKNVIIYHM